MDQNKFIRYINSFLGYNHHNGIKLVALEEGRSVVEVQLTRDSMNPQGTAHGGLIFSIADTAAGCACISRGRSAVTLSGNVNYLRPGKGEYLRAEATEQHYGSKTAVYRVCITDPQQNKVAELVMTFFLGEKMPEL
jgi:acyl-CoA thioesterase